MSRLRYDKEYAEAMPNVVNAAKPPKIDDALQIREAAKFFLDMAAKAGPSLDDIELSTFRVKSYDGAEVEVTQFIPPKAKDSPTPLPAVLYVHGGGMVGGSVEGFKSGIAYHARLAGVPVFAVHWRLAPEHPAPAGIEDCFAALKYISEHGSELNIDATRITILGFSAGGGVGTSTALVARDRQLSPPVAKLVLVYPMLDDRTDSPNDESEMGRFHLWPASWNVLAWKAYMGGPERLEAVSKMHASPARTKDFKGLPPTYLEVGTLDLFCSETIEFSKRLTESNVEVELHVWPGLPHGWEDAESISWHKKALGGRIEALTRF